MSDGLRTAARKCLPAPLRKLAGDLEFTVSRFIKGALFDLSGGEFRADGCTFAIPKHLTSLAYRSCFFDRSYEAEERELVRALVKPDDRVLELGACLGIVSCVTNKLLRDNSRHVVVEGNPFCIPSIHRNRELNHCGFLTENCAVSSQRDVTFYLHPVYIVGGTTQRQSGRPILVPGRSLLELEEKYGPFSALIMDVEGSELEVLAASGEALKKYRLVIVELHDWAIGVEGVGRCRAILEQSGLRQVKRAGLTEAWERL